MTSKDLATQQVRRRKRRLPPSVPEVKIRVYCPGCHEVQRGYGQWRALYGSEVRVHFRETVAAAPHRSSMGEALTSVRCPGGAVDLVKDRAP